VKVPVLSSAPKTRKDSKRETRANCSRYYSEVVVRPSTEVRVARRCPRISLGGAVSRGGRLLQETVARSASRRAQGRIACGSRGIEVRTCLTSDPRATGCKRSYVRFETRLPQSRDQQSCFILVIAIVLLQDFGARRCAKTAAFAQLQPKIADLFAKAPASSAQC
jgi:hypothetical protein